MRQLIFHTFTMGDVDDVEIYAAQPLWEWQQSEQGQWVIANCQDPKYNIGPDGRSWGHRVTVYGEVEDSAATFFQLKWGQYADTVG